ncbi:MAG TPA: TrkA family potassium uptake protein [Actinomycetota bacterium]|jgi:trk system potassium uptake protein TrkA|nr:TrkA family potassium uptake protein [Actinomycetota bacterium]
MTQKKMRIAIAGAGKVGRHVAEDLLSKGHDVVIIEQNVDKADLHKPYIEANWVIGDACEMHTLDSAVLSSCEVMVAATGDDEDNLVISLLAKQEFAVPRVVARINHPDNEWLFNASWGIDVGLSTPHLLTALVEEAVSVGDLVTLLNLEQGKVSLLEVTLADGSPARGKTVGDLRMPPDCTLVAVIRDRHVVAPQDETPLEVGDEVLALASPEAEEDLRRALTGN